MVGAEKLPVYRLTKREFAMAKYAAVQEAVRQTSKKNLALKKAIVKVIKSESSKTNGSVKQNAVGANLKKKTG